jgi:hypothetical protein
MNGRPVAGAAPPMNSPTEPSSLPRVGGRRESTPTWSRAAWGFGAAVVLVILVPLLVFPGTSADDLSKAPTAVGLRYLIIGYSALRLSQLFAEGKPKWFATMTWSFIYVWLGLAGLAQLFSGRDPFGYAVTPDADSKTSIVILCGTLAWDFAYKLARPKFRARTSVPIQRSFQVTPRRVAWISLFAYVTTPTLLLRQGGFTVFWQTRYEASASLAQAGVYTTTSKALGGIMFAFTHVPALVALIGLIVVTQQSPHLRRQPAWWLIGAATIALNALVNNPIGNSRFWFGTVLLGSLFSIRWFWRPPGFRLLLSALLLALTVAFPYADHFRSPDQQFVQRSISAQMVGKLDYDASAQITHGIRMTDSRGWSNGSQLLGVFAFAIPRSAWPDKPLPTGSEIGQFMYANFLNLSAPLWVEGYVNFGLFGTFIVLAFAGYFFGLADRRFWESVAAERVKLWLILVPPLAAYSMILMRGSLMATVGQGIVLVAVTLMLLERKPSLVVDRRPGL